jgi:hypothetical protein
MTGTQNASALNFGARRHVAQAKEGFAWRVFLMLICVLDQTLTPAERNLVQMDEHQRLRDIRMCTFTT